jgi:hypothetical protein
MADTSPPISPEELRTLVALAKRAIQSPPEIRKLLQTQGVTILAANRLSDIPLLEEVERSFESQFAEGPYNAASIFNPKVIAGFLDQLDGYADEFDPPSEGDIDVPAGFFWRNPAFSWSDAMAYYCVLRYFQPLCIVEIGSGFSTLVALQAIKRNRGGRSGVSSRFPDRGWNGWRESS